MSVTIDQIESIAPDQASLNAASKLLKRNKWPLLQHNADASVLWGQCQGSGSTPYSTSVATHDLGAKCSCPSRKFPCKHSIALMWWYAENANEFQTADAPEWVTAWLSRRRASNKDDTVDDATSVKPNLSVTSAKQQEPSKPLSTEEQQRKAERSARQKEKNRLARETSINQGLDELDLWISDQLEEGLAGFDSRGHAQVQMVTKRLVDAKAPGLALRVENLASRYFSTPFEQRNGVLLEGLGMLHLLANAYRKQQSLPANLQAEIRQAVGWNIEREPLLADKSADRRAGEWLVMGLREEVQADRMLRLETWLTQLDSSEPVTAVLIDFIPISSGASRSSAYSPGQRLKATMVFYPSATPLRALITDSTLMDNNVPSEIPQTRQSARAALDSFYQQRINNPWLSHWPLSISGAYIKRSTDDRLWLTNKDDTIALEVATTETESASVLLGLQDMTVYGLFNGRQVEPFAASTALGPWWKSNS